MLSMGSNKVTRHALLVFIWCSTFNYIFTMQDTQVQDEIAHMRSDEQSQDEVLNEPFSDTVSAETISDRKSVV